MSNVATYKHHKLCVTCRKLKPKSEFHAHVISADRLRPDCKVCRIEYERGRRAIRKQSA